MPTKLWCLLLWLAVLAGVYAANWLIFTAWSPLWLQVANPIIGLLLIFGVWWLGVEAVYMWKRSR